MCDWGHQVILSVRHSCPTLTGSQPHDHHKHTYVHSWTLSTRRCEHAISAQVVVTDSSMCYSELELAFQSSNRVLSLHIRKGRCYGWQFRKWKQPLSPLRLEFYGYTVLAKHSLIILVRPFCNSCFSLACPLLLFFFPCREGISRQQILTPQQISPTVLSLPFLNQILKSFGAHASQPCKQVQTSPPVHGNKT